MCILLIAIDFVADWPLLLLGNRDEYHARPSTVAQPWPGAPDCVGGLDQIGGGSWLAQRNDGRFAAVTNLRTGLPAKAPRSRGELVRDFVIGNTSAEVFGQRVLDHIDDYGPFNLVFGDAAAVWAIDGHGAAMQGLGAGVHVLSNGTIGSPWPKVERLAAGFKRTIRAGERDDESLLGLLADTAQPADGELPDTGVGAHLERVLAPVFIQGEHYGTRASSLVMRHEDGSLFFRERSYVAGGRLADEVSWECLAIEGEWRLG